MEGTQSFQGPAGRSKCQCCAWFCCLKAASLLPAVITICAILSSHACMLQHERNCNAVSQEPLQYCRRRLCIIALVQQQGLTYMLATQVFQHLWGTNELLSSFDSINVLRPGKHTVSTDDWLHCDQAPLRKGVACIQGIMNMVDGGPDTGTSHKHDILTASVMCTELPGLANHSSRIIRLRHN